MVRWAQLKVLKAMAAFLSGKVRHESRKVFVFASVKGEVFFGLSVLCEGARLLM